MALFNYATKEITLKVVYYGPGLSGKTTNIQYLHENINPQNKGKLLSLATEADRTLFFDFLPLDLGSVKGFRVKFQMYTVPGQVRYNATRRLVLKGADAVVFVADSQREMREQNVQSLENMKENLRANGLDPETIPLVLQWNKRDLPNVFSPEELDADLNDRGVPTFEAVALDGTGVQETFKEVTRMLVRDVVGKYQTELEPSTEPPPQPAAPSRPKRQLRPRRPTAAGFASQTSTKPSEPYMPGGGQMFDAESFGGAGEGDEGEMAVLEEIEVEGMLDADEVEMVEEAEEGDIAAEEFEPVEEMTAEVEESEEVFEETVEENVPESEDAELYAVPPRHEALEPSTEEAEEEESPEYNKEMMGVAGDVSAELEDLRRQNKEILTALKDIRALLRGSRKKWVRVSFK